MLQGVPIVWIKEKLLDFIDAVVRFLSFRFEDFKVSASCSRICSFVIFAAGFFSLEVGLFGYCAYEVCK